MNEDRKPKSDDIAVLNANCGKRHTTGRNKQRSMNTVQNR